MLVKNSALHLPASFLVVTVVHGASGLAISARDHSVGAVRVLLIVPYLRR